jgi:arylsulfatase A-like enzyme
MKLEDLGVADDTIVVYSTDNGYELILRPDCGSSPFRGEKGTTWEGGVRVPGVVRWPKNSCGGVSNGVQSHEDLYVTADLLVRSSSLTILFSIPLWNSKQNWSQMQKRPD